MFARISDALGCPKSVDHSSSISDSGTSWLSQSSKAYFITPAPILEDVLSQMKISRSLQSSLYFYDQFSPLGCVDRPQAQPLTPWNIVHSSRKRCKFVEPQLTETPHKCSGLIQELRVIASDVIDHCPTSCIRSSFSDLLTPIATTDPSSGAPDITDDDVLILFGSPPTIFQLLLSIPVLTSQLIDLMMELVACASPYSLQLISQFRQPVGLSTPFGTKQNFTQTVRRLLDLFQIITDPQIQSAILNVLPDLTSSPCASVNGDLTELDRSDLIDQLFTLLQTISLSTATVSATNEQHDPTCCLLECLTSFALDVHLTERLQDACFDLLDRCYAPETYYTYLPKVLRCLVVNGPPVPRSGACFSRLVTRVRTYFVFPKVKVDETVAGSVEFALVELLRLMFHFNRNILLEWMRCMNTTIINNLETSLDNLTEFHEQAVQDLLVLCVICSTVEMNVFGSLTNRINSDLQSTTALVSSNRMGGDLARLQKDAIALARRLFISGRLFPIRLRSKLMDQFFTRHASLITREDTRLFSVFLNFAGHLLTAMSLDMYASTEPIRELGTNFFINLFCSTSCSPEQQRAIVLHLTQHSLSGMHRSARRGITQNKERIVTRGSLSCLLRLSLQHPQRLAEYEMVLFAFVEQVFQSVVYASQENVPVSEIDFSSFLENARFIFTTLAAIAFHEREKRSLQEKLLGFLRKKFADPNLVCKAFSLVGCLAVLEAICRRTPSKSFLLKNDIQPVASTQLEDSTVLASQLMHVEPDRTSISSNATTSTSRTSNTSSLSLRGPGTGLADDANELNLFVEDTEDEQLLTSSSPVAPQIITPPSRLVLQLIGLVEHAIRAHPQLKCFWLDGLRACICRLSNLNTNGATPATTTDQPLMSQDQSMPKRHVNTQTRNLIQWMGARVMRDFQDGFVVDNASTPGYSTQFNLNDPAMCEVAINIGPNWSTYCSDISTHQQLTCNPSVRETTASTLLINPVLLPSIVRFLATTEWIQHDGRLDAIDALLGCPLLLPFKTVVEDALNSQHSAVPITVQEPPQLPDDPNLLLFVINWCLEMVNIFVPHVLSHQPTIQWNPISMRRSTLLNRLKQIACLRKQLFDTLCVLGQSSVGTPLKSDVNGNALPLHAWCLPTATYEPNRVWNAHPSARSIMTNSRTGSNCFTCGVHLNSTSIKDKIRNVSGQKSKCGSKPDRKQSASTSTRKPKRRKKTQEPADDRIEVTLAESDNENISEHRQSDDDANGTDDIEKQSKLVGVQCSRSVSGKGKGSIVPTPVSPNLNELSVCFRELDLSALVLGISAWPYPSASPSPSSTPPDLSDWRTLAWLLQNMTCKLDYLYSGSRSSNNYGWYAFQRLDSLNSGQRSLLLLHLVPQLQRILQFAVECFNTPDIHSSSELIDSSTCSESDQQPVTSTAALSKPSKSSVCIDLFSDIGLLVGDVICNCLHGLCLLCTGPVQLNAIVIPQFSNTASPFVRGAGKFTQDCIQRLAGSFEHSSGSAPNCSEQLGGFNPCEVVDLITECTSDNTSPAATYVPDYESVCVSLRSIIQWLLELSRLGLPHAPAAYLHARLVYRLTDAYFHCLASVISGSAQPQSNQPWFPDLYTYSKSLLSEEWNSKVHWKRHTYRDSLQGLIAMHLRVQIHDSPANGKLPTDCFSPSQLLDFQRTVLIPTVRRYSGEGDVADISGTTITHDYRTLTRQTADVYCREVMESTLWFTKQVCTVDKQDKDSSEEVKDCRRLTCWNECLVILGLMIELFKPTDRSQRGRLSKYPKCSDAHYRSMLSLLPAMLRSGRLFVQNLMKGGMPLMNAMFRQRGLEVTTFLRNTQTLTRFLQRICTHAKAYQDSQLTSQIPVTRRCLETFVYRVKLILSQHQCAEAFWMGTLKLRDIDGVDLIDDNINTASQSDPSQTSSHSTRSSHRASSLTIYSESLPAELLHGDLLGGSSSDSASDDDENGDVREDGSDC